MSITLSGLALPDDLIWSNAHAQPMVARSSRRTIGGALVVQDTGLSGGRQIDLTGEDAWCLKSLADTLAAWAATPGWTGVLRIHDAGQFHVRFRLGGDEPPVVAEMVNPVADPGPGTKFNLNIRLETV
ncbi:MAG: hypothetical protein GYA47_09530 [Desulfovibrio sp.]|nr:hypothetical protein [Desulfovibrio sp.]